MEQQIIPPFLTETGEAFEIPEEGSLGLLAFGYSGILLWRQKRNAVAAQRTAQTATQTATPTENSSQNDKS